MYFITFLFPFLLISGIDSFLYVKNVTLDSDILRKSFLGEVRSNDKLFEIGSEVENSNGYNSEKCIRSLKELSRVGNSMGVQLFDAWGKIQSGIHNHNSYDVGFFDQCVQASLKLSDIGDIFGQYCLAKLPIANASIMNDETSKTNLELSVGICVPNSCSPELIDTIVKKSLQLSSREIISNVTVSHCTDGRSPPLQIIHIFGIFVFFAITALMVASTGYEVYMNYTQKQVVPVLLAFSILTNGKKIFMINTAKSPNSIDCLTGLRVLSMFWVIHHHTLLINLFIPTMNPHKIHTWASQNIWIMTYVNAPITVDTFFFIAGLLIAWTGLKELDKTNGKLNVIMMYVHRYIRLTPAVAAILLFNYSLNELIYTGPFRELMLLTNKCDRTNWWPLLVYLQNYVTNNACLAETWYLAVDFHLYLLSPFLLIGVWRYGKKFLPVLIGLAMSSVAYIFWIYVSRGYTGTLIGNNAGEWQLTSTPTHARISPWVVGFALGYFMHNNRQKAFKIPKNIQISAWICSITTLLAIVFGPYFVMNSHGHSTHVIATSYACLKRILWAISLAWITFACHYDHGGVLNSFLSHPFWQPFARLAYCMYLVHMTCLRINFGSMRLLGYFAEFNLFKSFWSAIGLSLFFAIFLALGFEVPVLALEKFIFQEKKEKSQEDNNSQVDVKKTT